MKTIPRTLCVCCNNNLSTYWEIQDMPASNSTTIAPINNDEFYNFSIGVCTTCNLPQLIELIPLEILYGPNNPITYGNIWDRHFKQFADFIIKHVKNNKTIFEIGDPTFKSYHSCIKAGYKPKKWIIMDPNSNEDSLPDNCFRMKEWFDPNTPPMIQADYIITSHVFEHFYDPIPVLQQLGNISDTIIFSIPNMKVNAEKKRLPPLGMMFQHTFYLDEDILQNMLHRTNWRVVDIKYFEDNSIFFCAEKVKDIQNSLHVTNAGCLLHDLKTDLTHFVTEVNSKLVDKDNVYLFGSHFGTQILLNMGISENNISGVLDNNIQKSNRRLYGTNLTVSTPDTILEEHKHIYVIMFPFQSYWKEIIDGLDEKSNKHGATITFITPT